MWNDYNRFNQDGYSGDTIFPVETNYKNKRLFLEDLEKAEERERQHQEFLDTLREELRDTEMCKRYGEDYCM